MADNLLIKDGSLATAGGSLVTDAGGAACCCGGGTGGCVCLTDPRCSGGGAPFTESFIEWNHPADGRIAYRWTRDVPCCYDTGNWSIGGTLHTYQVLAGATYELRKEYFGGSAGSFQREREWVNGVLTSDTTFQNGWTPCNWGPSDILQSWNCPPYQTLNYSCSAGALLQTATEIEGWWQADLAGAHLGDGYVYTLISIRMDPDLNRVCKSSDCGACCAPDGFCYQAGSAECAAARGTWHAGIACADSPCGIGARGACCLPDGSCSTLTPDECRRRNGVPHLGLRCTEVQCQAPMGICCSPTGCLGQTTQANCPPPSQWYRNATDCSVCTLPPPIRPCCFPDGSCAMLTGADCNAQGGTWHMNGTTCEAAGCPVLGGACCYQDTNSHGQLVWTCVDGPSSTQATCDALSGTFYPGARCDQINRPINPGPTGRVLGFGAPIGHGPGGLL